ncbi:MAG TPA: succinate dehydrogenase assembly factor 2 [Candidatus Pelagibacter bacterium]|jgi:antitoxin CptB|nr:succinate dehydrogenase assembly factor 2 [Pelagibacteraceae bacterium]HJN84081.1 succinate dehydrogenase assembly factor 2 [Candidatus Pelagibacter bacterium]|tara:strand:- start:47 stop:310 length:264 start_codon:yes stop_codon:yes gene_type:complete
MTLNIEELKRKIIYRSIYRGTKEMDILLNAFTKTIIDKLNEKELQNLLDLLTIDDGNLYKFKEGKKINLTIKENRITKLFKEYVYKK